MYKLSWFSSETPKPFNATDIKLQSQTATEQSTIIIEKRDEKDEIIDISPIKSIQYTKPLQNISNSTTNSNEGKESKTEETVRIAKAQPPPKSPLIDLKTKLQEQATSLKDLSLAVKKPVASNQAVSKHQQQPTKVLQPVTTQTKQVSQAVKTKSQVNTAPKPTAATTLSANKTQPAQQKQLEAQQSTENNDVENEMLEIDDNRLRGKNVETGLKTFNLKPLKFASNKTVKTVSIHDILTSFQIQIND
jgi:hypothetical protein